MSAMPAAHSIRLPTALRRLAGKVLSFASPPRRRRPVLLPGDLSDHLRADLGLERWRGWRRPPRGSLRGHPIAITILPTWPAASRWR